MQYKITNDVLWRKVDGEVVIVHAQTGSSCYLNETGSEIWQLLNDGLPYENICKQMQEHYMGEKKQISNDVAAMLEELVSQKILERKS